MKSPTFFSFSFYSSCLWLLLALSLCTLCSCNQSSDQVQCLATERLALIQFKNSLVDRLNRLSSWSGDDCCTWFGVVCDNATHHVRELRLDGVYGNRLGGMISPSLIKLEQLRYLDLSCNDFGFTPIPSFIGSLRNLRYLNISRSYFAGEIPHQLANLSMLLVLDLHVDPYGLGILHPKNLKWIENMKQLQYLDMSGSNLTRASDWLQVISTLPSLQELYLFGCELTQLPNEPTIVNFTSLVVLDLSYNVFSGSLFPGWIFSLHNLVSLDLTFCHFGGLNPGTRGGFDSMFSLSTLRLTNNNFSNSPFTLRGLSSLSNLRLLDVSECSLSDPILGSLQNLSQIVHLDLSQNNIVEEIPRSLSSLCNLTTLYLRWNHFFGDVSELLERLCECESPKLEFLALNNNNLIGRLPKKLGRLKNLVEIDISYNEFTGILPRSLGSLSHLTTLQLSENQIEGSIPDSIGNLSSLTQLELSTNQIEGSIPDSIGDVSSLTRLDLSTNKVEGSIPYSIGALSSLETLYLSKNQIEGSIPYSIGDLSSLENLDLSDNKLTGCLPESIGKLGKLGSLSLHHTSLTCTVTENHFANLTDLYILWAGDNKLVFDIVNNWIPPFQLQMLILGSCNVGPLFPSWVQSQTNLDTLVLPNANISGTIPDWLWSNFSSLLICDISHNNIFGKFGDLGFVAPGGILDLSNNQFQGPLPRNFSRASLGSLDLSHNYLSGSLDRFLCSGIQEPRQLTVLNLANNILSGGITDCWMNWESLVILNLEKNKFSGNIPPSLGNIPSLGFLHMRNNKLSGELPMSLFNSKRLSIVDLAENELTGIIPTSIGRNVASLKIIILRSNKLKGEIPNEICYLSSIHILDLADNNFFGHLPKCFKNFISENKTYSFQGSTVTLVIKGHVYSYSTILYLLTTLDLSVNKFSGWIPDELMSVSGLQNLNLSHNKLTGRIPDTFSEMRELESLDLSQNNLDGNIPLSLAGLTTLSLLNVSYNKLTGKIPTGRQLQTFNESCFVGNALCGYPLPRCQQNTNDTTRTNDDHDEGTDWILVICMIVGLAVGFWITIGTLIVSKQWRDAYYHFLDEMRIKLANFILLLSMKVRLLGA